MDFSKLHLHWRPGHHKGKIYKSYSLARSYWQDGKSKKEIVVKLGKLSDSEADQWRNVLKMAKNPDMLTTNLTDIVVTKHFDYLEVSVAHEIWEEWRLDQVFGTSGKKSLEVAKIACLLAINRSICPYSKSQVPEWFRQTVLPWRLDAPQSMVNPSRIFRELDAIEEKKDEICKHLYTRMCKANPKAMESIFYDLSSTTFEGSQCILMRWGHCKEGYKNHIVLALVVNSEGLPFYWEILPGNTADSKTITWLVDRLKNRLQITDPTFVFDRGMVSDDNLTLLKNSDIKYITAMDRNQLESCTDFDFTPFASSEEEFSKEKPEGFEKMDESTYYKEMKIKKGRRYILCFNPQLFKDQRQARKRAVEGFKQSVKEINEELLQAKKSRSKESTESKFQRKLVKAKLTNFVTFKLRETKIVKEERSIRTYQASVQVKKEKMQESGKLDGFWLLVTNHVKKGEKHSEKLIQPYRDKVVIESSFRDIKSCIEISPVHVWTEQHVKAHYTICVLAHLMNRTIALRLHKNPGTITEDVVSPQKLYEALSSCKLNKIEIQNKSLNTYQLTLPTDQQKELLNRLALNHLIEKKEVEKLVDKLKSGQT